ncbi:response regulator [Caulobacter sp. DWR1-3-2b1]|uniref:response regulator n=1 Tax=Caulobacter sp. DWR1-3-2b1 TaxID=2804670 RepID=UPI003CE67802
MQPSTYFNLEKARALVVDNNTQSLDIICGILASFGLRQVVRKANGREAQEELMARPVDLILTDAALPEMDGYELIHWLRREPGEKRMTPAIIVSAHTPRNKVIKARDCGANFTIAKPIAPNVVLERILWVARADRLFIECDVYMGPDRRWRNAGPPLEHPDGRRRDDRPAEVGIPEGDNLSSSELDQLIKPQRLAG